MKCLELLILSGDTMAWKPVLAPPRIIAQGYMPVR